MRPIGLSSTIAIFIEVVNFLLMYFQTDMDGKGEVYTGQRDWTTFWWEI